MKAPFLIVTIALLALLPGNRFAPGCPDSSHGRYTLSAVGSTVRLSVDSRPISRISLGACSAKQIVLTPLNGRLSAIVLVRGDGPQVRIYDAEGGRLREIWHGLASHLNPWKIAVADVDNDRRDDVAVGVYKKALYHPVMARRLFVYNWDGKQLYPKWLGSRLSRPFTDFAFEDSPSGCRLIATEITRGGDLDSRTYAWNGFGFSREGEAPAEPSTQNHTLEREAPAEPSTQNRTLEREAPAEPSTQNRTLEREAPAEPSTQNHTREGEAPAEPSTQNRTLEGEAPAEPTSHGPQHSLDGSAGASPSHTRLEVQK